MAQIPDDSQGYDPGGPMPTGETPRLGNGCLSTGLVAAMGAALFTMGYAIATRDHLHGPQVVAIYAFLALAARCKSLSLTIFS